MPTSRFRRAGRWTALLAAVACLGSAAPAGAVVPHTAKYPFAGYITSPATVTSSSATIVIPTYSCTKKLAAIAAGATVYDSNGALFSAAEVYIGCSGNTVFLSALVDVDNAFSAPSVTMAAGDTVALSATCGPSGITVTVDDTTTNSTGSATSVTPETCTQAEIGDDAVVKGRSIVVAPSFGAITFTSAMVNGVAIGSLGPTQTNLFEGKKNVVTTGSLAAGGTSFVTTRG